MTGVSGELDHGPGIFEPELSPAVMTNESNSDYQATLGGPEAPSAPGLQPASFTSGSLVDDPEDLRRQWEAVQVAFVDDPSRSVDDAEKLVSSAIDQMLAGFQRQRRRLDDQWSDGEEPSTDDLRNAFQRYRDFFERVLAA
jgi:hypothetical protein